MDYLKIVLQGYNGGRVWRHLDEYYFREFKKAEKEGFKADVFFDGCLSIVKKFEEEIDLTLNNYVSCLLLTRKCAGDNIKIINDCNKELSSKGLSLSDDHYFRVNAPLSYGWFPGYMSYDEVQRIKLSINKAFQLAQPEQDPLKPKMTAKLFALCVYLLENAKYIKGTKENIIDKAKKLLSIENFKTSTIRKEYYNVRYGTKGGLLNPVNLMNALIWLKDFPEAVKIGESTLSSFE